MKYRDPKTGEVFEEILAVRNHYCSAKNDADVNACRRCVVGSSNNTDGTTCSDFCTAHPAEAAHLMGYEVIEDEPYDSSVTCGICEHSKPFGIYGTVKCTKTDRYLPCEHKCDWEEDNMDKQDKPRLAEVLGVEVGERFTNKELTGKYRRYFWIDEYGEPRPSDSFDEHTDSMFWILRSINHPESIIRAPQLTEPEIAIMRAVGAKWVSLAGPPSNAVRVELWMEKPEQRQDGTYFGQGSVARVNVGLFPSVRPGDCICVEEADGDEE